MNNIPLVPFFTSKSVLVATAWLDMTVSRSSNTSFLVTELRNVKLEYLLGTRVAITPGSKFDVKRKFRDRELRGRLAFSLRNST